MSTPLCNPFYLIDHHVQADTNIFRLKKATNRMGTTLMQKTGHVERTVDREFAEEEGRYRTSALLSTCTAPRQDAADSRLIS